jgi:hypothetical protein
VANLWTSQTPGLPDVFESAAVTVGITLTFASAGTVTGARFYGPATVGVGTFEAAFWVITASDSGTGAGTLLANATYGTITAGAWNSVAFSSGVAVDTSHAYAVAVRTSQGRYTATSAFFTSALTNGNITGIQDGTDPVGLGALSNGRFTSGLSAYPNSTFNSNAYFVDVDYTPGSVAAPAPPFRAQHSFL